MTTQKDTEIPPSHRLTEYTATHRAITFLKEIQKLAA